MRKKFLFLWLLFITIGCGENCVKDLSGIPEEIKEQLICTNYWLLIENNVDKIIFYDDFIMDYYEKKLKKNRKNKDGTLYGFTVLTDSCNDIYIRKEKDEKKVEDYFIAKTIVHETYHIYSDTINEEEAEKAENDFLEKYKQCQVDK